MSQNRTCLDCGFLTIQGSELSRSERIMIGTLGTQGISAAMPSHPEQTRCFKNLWDYDLHYIGDTLDGVIDEINRSRDDCSGFALYEAGFNPSQHLEKQMEQRKEKLQWRIAKLGFLGALLGGIAGTIIFEIIKWIIAYLKAS